MLRNISAFTRVFNNMKCCAADPEPTGLLWLSCVPDLRRTA